MKIQLGYGDEIYGTVEATKDGLSYIGPNVDAIKNLLPSMRIGTMSDDALLASLPRRLVNRVWAKVIPESDDGRPFVRASTKKWRQPTPEQLKCEQDLASYLNKLNLSIKRDGRTLNVDALDQAQAAQDILPYLQQAETLGKQYASHYIERGVGSFVGSLLDMAANLITRDISWFSDLFKQRLEGLDADVGIEEIAAAEDDVVQQVAQQVAETLAVTEVQTVIERMVMQQMDTAGVSQIESVTEPDACDACAMNEDYGPIDIGEIFPSGHTAPPYHDRCRCHVQPATT